MNDDIIRMARSAGMHYSGACTLTGMESHVERFANLVAAAAIRARGQHMTTQIEAMKLALEALELAQDNMRDHGDECFLHDKGEYNRCFCGKDSLSDHLQSVVEKLDEALSEQPAQQEPFAFTDSYGNLWTKSAAKQLIDKSILLPLYVGKPEH